MKIFLNSVGLLGVLLFAGLLSMTFFSQQTLGNAAQDFVKKQIAHEIKLKQSAINDKLASKNAQRIADKLGIEKAQVQANLDHQLPEKIAAVLASMCGYDCEKQKLISQSITSIYQDKINKINIAENTLDELIKGQYLNIVGKLMRDIRIFLTTNLFLFVVLLLALFLKPKATTHLLVPAFLLVASVLISCSIYLLGQNWFYTIIFNDYMGFTYLAYNLVIFASLLDVILNRARLITKVVNAVADAIGSAFSMIPCP